MPAMHITLTDRLSPADYESFAQVLRPHIDIEECQFIARCSAADTLDQSIRILGNWELWAVVFGVPAAGFFTKLSHRAADQLWDAVKEWLKHDEAQPLADFSKAASALASENASRATVVVGIDIPDNYFGTSLTIRATEPEKIAYEIAKFVVSAEKISNRMKEEIAGGKVPLGPAIITISTNGGVNVKWLCRSDMSKKEINI